MKRRAALSRPAGSRPKRCHISPAGGRHSVNLHRGAPSISKALPTDRPRSSCHPRSALPSGQEGFALLQVSRRSALTRVTLALPELCKALNAFLGVLFPQSTWNSVCVAHNIVTAAHRDTANVQGSLNLSVSLGDFTGGQLWLADEHASIFRYIPALKQNIPGRILCTKENPTSFPAQLMLGM